MNTREETQPTVNLTLTTASPAETERLGERIGALLESGDLVCLTGSLGAGKTCLTRGLARAWGALEQPTSPTFTLINEYRRDGGADRFYHVDCYRLQSIADAVTTGITDLLDEQTGVVVIEWPERIEELLPVERLTITIERTGKGQRRFLIAAHGDRPVELQGALKG